MVGSKSIRWPCPGLTSPYSRSLDSEYTSTKVIHVIVNRDQDHDVKNKTFAQVLKQVQVRGEKMLSTFSLTRYLNHDSKEMS